MGIRVATVALLLMAAGGCQREPAQQSTPAEPQRRSAPRPQPQPREVRTVRSIDPATIAPGTLALPNKLGTVKFAVIGDSGRGNAPQYDVAAQMVSYRKDFRYAFVIMNGDNLYEGPATADDYRDKFERPYAQLLSDGVKFYAVLGNHDDPREIHYAPFNMNGQRYYTFDPPEDPVTRLLTHVRFFALDTVTLDRAQLRWLREQFARSSADWKICFFHHPLYTSGRYVRGSRAYRIALEPMFREYGVDAVFSGHEHFYMRSKLESGIQYFVSGGAGSLRYGDSGPSPVAARAFDTDYHFMLVEIERDALWFQAIARTGRTVDAGTLSRRDATSSTDTAARPQSGVRVP
jgi:hypothetical protein